MKIFLVMFDMLKIDNLSSYNGDLEDSEIDKYIKTNGGNFYSNMYAGGADTPRAMSEFWSGNFHFKNGCDTRAHYPEYFLNSISLIDILRENDYNINFNCSYNDYKLGMFPGLLEENCCFEEIDNFINNLNQDKNHKQFNFVYVNEYHNLINKTGANRRSVKNGMIVVNSVMKKLSHHLKQSDYDLILFFSDHGHLMIDQYRLNRFSMKLNLSLLSKNIFIESRSKVFQYWKFKDSSAVLNIDSNLRSIADFAPTLAKFIGIKFKQSVDGKNLLTTTGHEYLILTDFYKLYSDFFMKVDIWGVRRIGTLSLFSDGLNFEANSEDKSILFKSCKSFIEHLKIKQVMSEYEIYKLGDYFEAKNKFFNYLVNLNRLIKRFLYNFIYF